VLSTTTFCSMLALRLRDTDYVPIKGKPVELTLDLALGMHKSMISL
jgi:hypothetical protein